MNKQVYLFYKEPYHTNAGYIEEFKAYLKVSEDHNGNAGYHPVLAEAELLENHNITRDS